MDKIRTTEGDLLVRDARFALVASRFNDFIVESLLKGAVHALKQHGAAEADIEIVRVPGAFEMPVVVGKLAASRRFDGIVALGAVIRGGTPHFDYVCRAVTDGVREAEHETGVPVAFGVLTVDDVDQAMERAGGAEGNKGAEAAAVAVEMARLLPALKAPPEDEGAP